MKRYMIVGALAGVVLIALVAVRRGERAAAATRTSDDSGRVVELGASDLARAARVDLVAGVPVSGTLDPAVVIRIASPILEVVDAEVSLRAAESGEALAKKKLKESTVRAPSSGVISQRAVDSGDRVKDGDLLFQLVNTSELEFAATVPSEYAADVRVGAPVVLAVSGATDAGLSGRVSRVNATVDPATRQVKVYVTVANSARRLVGGLFAS